MDNETKNTCAEMDNHDHEHNGPQKIGKLNNLKVIGTIKIQHYVIKFVSDLW
jgi:hypothetical protein